MGVNESPLYLVAVIRPRMDVADQAEAAIAPMIAGTRGEPGCISYELLVSEDDPSTWVMMEKFRSRADWEAHMATEHVRAGNAALEGLLREPTELTFYTARM
jgi:quinol monooxygenase YgiN